MALAVARTVDPELGMMRYCRRCDEWWPEDAEFWVTTRTGTKICRACQREWTRVAKARHRARYKLVRGEPGPCKCKHCNGCPTVTPFGVCRFCRRHEVAQRDEDGGR